MKIYLLALLLLVNLISYSQINSVRDGSVEFNDTTRYCVELEVEAVPKEIEGEWRKFLKKNYKIKAKQYVGDFYMAEDVIYNKISKKNVDLKFKSHVKDTTTVLQIFIQFKNGDYINPTDQPSEVSRLKGEVKSFLTQFVDDYYNSVLKPLQKKKKSIEKDVSKIEKDISNENKTLGKNKSSIQKNEDKIKSYQDKIDKYTEKIEELNSDIETGTKENEETVEENSKISEEIKAYESEYKELIEKLKSVNKEIKSVENKK